jgi:quinol-cytochrome oxidoreductase complex cytochrome b subunit
MKGSVTPLRLAIWIVGGAFAIVLIATGIVGILTKAR